MSVSALCIRVTVEKKSPPAIMIQSTSARFAPLADATVHFNAPEGMKVAIKEDRGQWRFIERADGNQGWIQSGTFERIAAY